jgi:hypothetical protein
MTGGIGFSSQANQSLKDNHKLGKIRPKSMALEGSRNSEKANPNSIAESISYRFSRKRLVETSRKYILWGMILLILALLYASYLN